MKCKNCENGQVDIGDGNESILVACLDCNASKTVPVVARMDGRTIGEGTVGQALIFNSVKPASKDRVILGVLLSVFTFISFLTILLLSGCGSQSVAGSTPSAMVLTANDGATCYAIMQDGKAVGGNCIR